MAQLDIIRELVIIINNIGLSILGYQYLRNDQLTNDGRIGHSVHAHAQ